MAPEVLATDGLKRVADQLQILSQLTETLTYRLLELEERVAVADLRLEPLLGGGSDAGQLAEDAELRLDETEERLARLEALLAGLQPVARVQESVFASEAHFPDEDFEQPFLDEPSLDAQSLDEQSFDEPEPSSFDDDERLIA